MKRMLAVFFALLFALSACSMNHQRRIEPLDGAQVSEIEQKINYGAPTENGLSQFYLRYHWNGTPQSIFEWFEIYENGKMTEKGETSNTNAVGDTGVLLFSAHGEGSLWWAINLIDEGSENGFAGGKTTQNDPLEKDFAFTVPVIAEKALELIPNQDTVVMALLYGNGNKDALQKITLKDLQDGPQPLSEVELAVVLKCNIL